MSRLVPAFLALSACTSAAPAPRDASVEAAPEVSPDASVPERTRAPSTRALADLAGFSLPYRDLPTAANPASAARRAWAIRTVRELGLHRIRREVFWTDVEPREGEFHFEAYDPIVQGCADAHVELLGVLAYGNVWATRAANADPYFPPDDPRTFGRFAAAVVRRYRDRVHD